MHCFRRFLPVVSEFGLSLPFPPRPISARWRTFSKSIDDTRVPVLHEEDLEESFVRGSGPGGQSVAKTNNKVVLTHKPTGLVVHCHTSRSLFENRREARKLLVAKLDQLLNGEQSVAGQRKVIDQRKQTESLRRKMRLQAKKKAWKERESTEGSKEPSPHVD